MRFARSGRRGLLAPLALALLALAPAAARADVTSSQITTPADPLYTTYPADDFNSSTPHPLQIAGTSNGTVVDGVADKVAIRCYFSHDNGRDSFSLGTADVDASGTFALTADVSDLFNAERFVGSHSCVLRAVPADQDPAFVTAFAGPSVHAGLDFGESRDVADRLYDWGVFDPQPKGAWGYRAGAVPFWAFFGPGVGSVSPGATATASASFIPWSCTGLTGVPYTDGTLYASQDQLVPWVCSGGLERYDYIDSSGIVVDGHFAYDAREQHGVNSGADGLSALEKSYAVDGSNGNVTITERSDIRRCVDQNGDAVDSLEPSGCVGFVATGVVLERRIVQDREGQTVTITDDWISQDGVPHKVQLGYLNGSFGGGGGGSVTYRLPGDQDYAAPYTSAIEGLASAPATIRVRVTNAGEGGGVVLRRAAVGGDEHAAVYGSLTYTSAPDGLVWPGDGYFTARYTRTIPGNGKVSLTHIYGVAPTADQIGVLGVAVEDKLVGPSVSITTPASGSTVRAAGQTVTGTATDNVGIKSLTINGKAVAVGANGAYSTPITLQRGQNTITAVATDAEGNSAQAQSVVTYVPQAARTCKVPNVKGKRLTAARKALRKAGCVPGKVRSKATRKVKPGVVMTQGRQAGARVAVGTRVNLTIARAKARRAVRPQFTG